MNKEHNDKMYNKNEEDKCQSCSKVNNVIRQYLPVIIAFVITIQLITLASIANLSTKVDLVRKNSINKNSLNNYIEDYIDEIPSVDYNPQFQEIEEKLEEILDNESEKFSKEEMRTWVDQAVKDAIKETVKTKEENLENKVESTTSFLGDKFKKSIDNLNDKLNKEDDNKNNQ